MRSHAIALVMIALLAAAAIASPPPCGDADILALDISGSLLADPTMVAQISQDLDAIHTAFPGWVDGVDGIHATAGWVPGVILVQMTPQAWADYQAGVFTGFNDLNAQYGPVTISPVALNYTIMLEFPVAYNSAQIASIYSQVAGIAFAQPNYLYGDGDDITSSQVGRYLFKRGWGMCLAGCFYHHFWDFEVVGGNVTLVAEWGDPTLTDVGDTPGAAARLVGNLPNPFSNTTTVTYQVTNPTHVQLRIYDASGRLVKALRDAPAAPGTATVEWNGTNDAGHRVASGVYFCNLLAGGVTQTRKMVITR